MKTVRRLLPLCAAVFPTLILTSCEVHVGSARYEVPWYVIAVPSVLFIAASVVITGFILSKNTYVCPVCGHKFKPKWWQGLLSAQIGSERTFRCPECGNKGFCRKVDRDRTKQ